MGTVARQVELFEDLTPASTWGRDVARRALDELFSLARQHKSTTAYREFIDFVAGFRFYSPFNALLVHIQMPGATFVAPAHRWLHKYVRRIKAEARPLVILQPKGPVMFVFDVADTEPGKDSPPLPPEVEHPFGIRRGGVGRELPRTVENAKRDGVSVTERRAGSQSAGAIRIAKPGRLLNVRAKVQPEPKYVQVLLRYELLLNANHSGASKYATLVHELAHLYCGHVGTPNQKWWPDRRGLAEEACEFEAESICYLVCKRLGIESPSDEYLAGYLKLHNQTPSISLECVTKAAGLIEQMGQGSLKPRKEKEQ